MQLSSLFIGQIVHWLKECDALTIVVVICCVAAIAGMSFLIWLLVDLGREIKQFYNYNK